MSESHFREIDKEGWEILDVISQADKFNEWMYQTIRPYCSGKILEIGSGIGNISKFFIELSVDITLSDIRANYCEVLKRKFPQCKHVVQLDLTHPYFDKEYSEYINMFDTVFALNVVEHIKEDDLALANCFKLLKNDGKVVILVPAYQKLYNKFDKELEHFRRYTRKQLNYIVKRSGFQVINSQYFNLMGIFGWYFSGKLQKHKSIPKNQMSLYNKLVPIFKLIDQLLLNKIGLSVISVGVKAFHIDESRHNLQRKS
ncbi:MAG: class I SAM-dependent methyltransferase [Flammeovirgaceae bacterium]